MANDKQERAYTPKAGTKAKHKKQSEPFVMLPFEVISSSAYASLGGSAAKLLIELVYVYYGSNNGSLWIAPKRLNERGFSKSTAIRAYKELLIHGFIFMTRKGGNQKGGCSWFALTWLPINKTAGMDLTCYESKKFLKFTLQEKNSRVNLNPAWCHFDTTSKSDSSKGNAKKSKSKSLGFSNSSRAGVILNPLIDIAIYRDGILDEQPQDNSQNWIAQDQARLKGVGLAGTQSYQLPTIH
jgi:hypothetical protein